MPRGVKLKNMDLTVSLEGLSFFLVQGRKARSRAKNGACLTSTRPGGSGWWTSARKPVTAREAVARGHIRLSAEALRQIRAGGMKKGDPLETARLAGIMAAKQTRVADPALPSAADLARRRHADARSATATTSRRRCGRPRQTGVEMEALTAVSVAALTIYDMVKAVDKAMVIGDIRLVKKTK